MKRISGVFLSTRRAFLNSASAILALSVAAPAIAHSDGPIPVVATFSILGDMVKRIGGEHAAVKTLVGPDGDTHVFQPTPADARAVSEAKIIVVNGLQFEGWLDRLTEASDFRGVRVVATDGIEPIPLEHGADTHARDDHDDGGEHAEHDDHDDGDEHAEHDDHDARRPWPRPRCIRPPCMAEPPRSSGLRGQHHRRALQGRSRECRCVLPESRSLCVRDRSSRFGDPRDRWQASEGSRTVVTSHDAFQYFGRDYGLEFVAPQGLSTESEASAKDVARLILQIREQGIRAVFIENIGDRRLLRSIADETGAVIGGTLYPGALSGPDGPAATYLDMMRHNATTLAQALAS